MVASGVFAECTIRIEPHRRIGGVFLKRLLWFACFPFPDRKSRRRKARRRSEWKETRARRRNIFVHYTWRCLTKRERRISWNFMSLQQCANAFLSRLLAHISPTRSVFSLWNVLARAYTHEYSWMSTNKCEKYIFNVWETRKVYLIINKMRKKCT